MNPALPKIIKADMIRNSRVVLSKIKKRIKFQKKGRAG